MTVSPSAAQTMVDADTQPNGVSVIVPVTERPHDLAWLYNTYSGEFRDHGRPFEFVFVVEPWAWNLADSLKPLIESGEPIRVVRVGQTVGESALLDLAGSTSDNPILVTLPSYPRVQPGTLEGLVAGVESGADLTTAVRDSANNSVLNRLQHGAFHWLLSGSVGGDFRDVASGVRAFRRTVLDEVPLYGDFFRFLPVLVQREGFVVEEVEVEQHPDDGKTRLYSPGIYLRRMIDLLGLFFLVRFTQKPLRFFGLLGAGLSIVGALILLIVFVQRIMGQGLADRPLLLLGTILFVLGLQAVAMGLIGEIIVHLNASRRRLYRLRDDTAGAE